VKAKADVKVTEKSLNDALAECKGISARKLERASSKPPVAVYEVKMEGFG
jgi:hypothetical protein